MQISYLNMQNLEWYLADLKSTGKNTIETVEKSLTDMFIRLVRIYPCLHKFVNHCDPYFSRCEPFMLGSAPLLWTYSNPVIALLYYGFYPFKVCQHNLVHV